jgi:glycine/D-amino acid oxidase-like deaminating enzyme
MTTDFLIIGGGITGMWVAHYLIQYQQNCLLIDEGLPNTASRIASGVMNPITGKYLIKTWRADDFFPHAQQAYTQLCQQLSLPHTTRPINIVWLIKQQQQWQEMQQLSQTETIAPWIHQLQQNNYLPQLQQHYGHIAIKAYFIELHKLIPAFHQYLAQKNAILYQKMNYQDCQIHTNGITWGDIKAKHVIFCDGIAALQNPYFQHLPLVPLKGERLLVQLPDLPNITNIIKASGLSIVPHTAPDIYWVGSNYQHWNNNPTPTTEQYQKFTQTLDQLLHIPYQVLDHQAAIRPAVLHRYPFVGKHPQYPQLSVLNGMGTKGTTLAPFFAQQLIQHLLYQHPIDPEVSIDQYKKN